MGKVEELQTQKRQIIKENREDKHERVGNINEKISNALIEVQNDLVEEELVKFKRIKESKGKAAAVFKLKDSIFGNKKSPLDPVALKDPNTGLLVTTPQEIKRVSLAYCVNHLTNREPKPEFRDQYAAKVFLHEIRMREIISNDIDELTPDTFQTALDVISKKPGDKYKLIIRA